MRIFGPDLQAADLSGNNDSEQPEIDLSKVWSLPWESVASLQFSPNYSLADDVIAIPKEWLPPNGRQRSKYTVDFLRGVPDSWPRDDPRTEMALRRLKRLCYLDLTQTVHTRRGRSRPSKPHTWIARCKLLLNASKSALLLQEIKPAVRTTCPDGLPIFQCLTSEMFGSLRKQHKNFFRMNVARLNGLAESGAFDDWPAFDIAVQRCEEKPSQPFSDQAFTEIIRACIFLAEIQEDLEACWSKISAITSDGEGRTSERFVEPFKKSLLYNWRGKVLRPGFRFAFQFDVSSSRRRSETVERWPLATVDSVHSLLRLCQVANAQIVHLTMAGRVGELISLKRGSLEPFEGGASIRGLTFKTNSSVGGITREWPLPSFAVEAVCRQETLSRTLGSKGQSLWVLNNNNRSGGASLDRSMTQFGQRVRLSNGVKLSSLAGTLNSRRYRKTMARLVGLALEGASGILSDLFGHRDRDVTLGYLLSDQEFQAEADLVREEVQAVRKREISKELSECGGNAARTLRVTRDEMRARGIREDFGRDDTELLISLMPTLQQVGPNRYCIAELKDIGLCSKVAGQRDVGACSSSCMYRLERAAAHKDRKDAICVALEALSHGGNKGVRVFYQNQIIAKLSAFDTLIDSFEEDERFVPAFGDFDHRTIDQVPPSIRRKFCKLIGAM